MTPEDIAHLDDARLRTEIVLAIDTCRWLVAYPGQEPTDWVRHAAGIRAHVLYPLADPATAADPALDRARPLVEGVRKREGAVAYDALVRDARRIEQPAAHA